MLFSPLVLILSLPRPPITLHIPKLDNIVGMGEEHITLLWFRQASLGVYVYVATGNRGGRRDKCGYGNGSHPRLTGLRRPFIVEVWLLNIHVISFILNIYKYSGSGADYHYLYKKQIIIVCPSHPILSPTAMP